MPNLARRAAASAVCTGRVVISAPRDRSCCRAPSAIRGRTEFSVRRRTITLLARHLGELLDRLERAVGLDHGHEHLVEPFVVLGPVGHGKAADLERAGPLDGLEQA